MKRVRLKKHSARPIPKLKRELWSLFSKYIRERDKFTCVACGKKAEGSAMHASHLIPRSVCGAYLYFHEKNVGAGCYRCNINLGGNSIIYAQKLKEKYGYDVAEELYNLRKETKNFQWDRKKLEVLIQCLKDAPEFFPETYEVVRNMP